MLNGNCGEVVALSPSAFLAPRCSFRSFPLVPDSSFYRKQVSVEPFGFPCSVSPNRLTLCFLGPPVKAIECSMCFYNFPCPRVGQEIVRWFTLRGAWPRHNVSAILVVCGAQQS